jgi:hypothetical protein
MLLMTMAIGGCFAVAFSAHAAGGCSTEKCHQGIADIRSPDSEMMQTIKANGSQHGDPDGCVICHGGNPRATEKKEAHKGIPATLKLAPGPKDYYPDPGSIWIAENSCGVCHVGYVYRAKVSLMNTEAGKIQGNLHTWGFEEVANFSARATRPKTAFCSAAAATPSAMSSAGATGSSFTRPPATSSRFRCSKT